MFFRARRRGQHQIRRRGMGKAAGEMMLDEPGGVVSQAVGDIDLLQDVMKHLLLDGGCAPAYRDLEEYPEIPLRHGRPHSPGS